MSEFTHLIDLASARLGGEAVATNDDFFAEKENLVKAEAPIFIPGKYTDRGKWMDGWESRRRRIAAAWIILPPMLRSRAIGDWEVKSMDWHDYISIDPRIIVGKPAVKGTRLGVEFLLELLAAGWSEQVILDNYHRLTMEQLRAVMAYGAECVEEREFSSELMAAR